LGVPSPASPSLGEDKLLIMLDEVIEKLACLVQDLGALWHSNHEV
jgi:hypothetical protein